jgi:hypothetical protein
VGGDGGSNGDQSALLHFFSFASFLMCFVLGNFFFLQRICLWQERERERERECVCVCAHLGVWESVCCRGCECASVFRCSRGESRQNEEDDNFALLLLTSRLCRFFHIIINTSLYGNFNFPTFAKI